MNTGALSRVARQTILLAAPVALVFLSSAPFKAIAWIATICWIILLARRAAPSTVRISIGFAVLVNAIYFAVLPAGRAWPYLVAAATLFLFWSAYQEEAERPRVRPRSQGASTSPPTMSMAGDFRKVAGLIENNRQVLQMHDPARLSAFVLTSTCRLLARVADHQKLAPNDWIEVAIQCRYHLDCMWWLHLLNQGHSEDDIAKLYPLVNESLSTVSESAALNPAIRAPLSGMVDRERVTGASIRKAYSGYVLNDLPAEVKDLLGGGKPVDQRWRHALLMMLWLEERVPAIAGKKPITLALIEESLGCWDHPLLTGFDLSQCPIVELPASLLE